MPIHKRLLIGCEEHRRRADLVKPPPPPRRSALAHPVVELLVLDQRGIELSGEVARRDRIYCDVMRSEFHGQLARHRMHGAFARHISRDGWAGEERTGRSGHDDAARLARNHDTGRLAREHPDCGEIGVEHAFEVGSLELSDGTPMLYASVRDKNVETAVALQRALNARG